MDFIPREKKWQLYCHPKFPREFSIATQNSVKTTWQWKLLLGILYSKPCDNNVYIHKPSSNCVADSVANYIFGKVTNFWILRKTWLVQIKILGHPNQGNECAFVYSVEISPREQSYHNILAFFKDIWLYFFFLCFFFFYQFDVNFCVFHSPQHFRRPGLQMPFRRCKFQPHFT